MLIPNSKRRKKKRISKSRQKRRKGCKTWSSLLDVQIGREVRKSVSNQLSKSKLYSIPKLVTSKTILTQSYSRPSCKEVTKRKKRRIPTYDVCDFQFKFINDTQW